MKDFDNNLTSSPQELIYHQTRQERRKRYYVAMAIAPAFLGILVLLCWFICAKIEPAVRGAMTRTISYFGQLPERLPASSRPAFSRGLGLRLPVPAKITDTLR